MSTDINSITCGSFTAVCIGYNQWEITCSWLPDWVYTANCTKNKVADLLIRIQAENRRPKLEVVK